MIVYRTGDATNPPERPAVLIHVVNSQGLWGKGFTAALDARFGSAPKESYLKWYNGQAPFELGTSALVVVGDVTIIHLLAQRGVGRSRQRLEYTALAACFDTLVNYPVLHMPRIGTGYGGGRWDVIARMLEELPSTCCVYTQEAP